VGAVVSTERSVSVLRGRCKPGFSSPRRCGRRRAGAALDVGPERAELGEEGAIGVPIAGLSLYSRVPLLRRFALNPTDFREERIIACLSDPLQSGFRLSR
jgi:hypothetical protein